MKCIIKIDNFGNAIDKPLDLESFLELNPDIDISIDLPVGYVWGVTSTINELFLKDTQKLSFTYADTGKGYYQQTYTIIDKTPEEIESLALKIKDYPPFTNWIWNADTYTWSPPIDRPRDTKKDYYWNETANSWEESGDTGKHTPIILPTGLTPKEVPLKVNVENKTYTITFF
jgi:hypothetical protein